jgi:hypothetical protein
MTVDSRNPKLFVLRIEAACGHVFTFAVQQVAKVVKQRSDNQSVFGAFALNEPCGLQTVLEHCDRFAEVRFGATAFEERKDFID